VRNKKKTKKKQTRKSSHQPLLKLRPPPSVEIENKHILRIRTKAPPTWAVSDGNRIVVVTTSLKKVRITPLLSCPSTCLPFTFLYPPPAPPTFGYKSGLLARASVMFQQERDYSHALTNLQKLVSIRL